MHNQHAADGMLTKNVRARLFNLCLTLAGFFLSLARALCASKATAASAELTVAAAKLPQQAESFDRGWQGQTA